MRKANGIHGSAWRVLSIFASAIAVMACSGDADTGPEMVEPGPDNLSALEWDVTLCCNADVQAGTFSWGSNPLALSQSAGAGALAFVRYSLWVPAADGDADGFRFRFQLRTVEARSVRVEVVRGFPIDGELPDILAETSYSGTAEWRAGELTGGVGGSTTGVTLRLTLQAAEGPSSAEFRSLFFERIG